MADATKIIFKNKRIIVDKLTEYGFAAEGNRYRLCTTLEDSGFVMQVDVFAEGKEISAEVIDPTLSEPYTLHLADNASGSFVGKVRQEYESILQDIANNCCETQIFKSAQTQRCIEYISKKYGDELEYLWPKFPDNAIWRRADNKKWYGVLMTVSANKLGFAGSDTLEIIDLRMLPDEKQQLIDNKNFLLGYHMNKNSWLSIVLDGRLCDEKLFERIDASHHLANKK